jgi:hypothetical protein
VPTTARQAYTPTCVYTVLHSDSLKRFYKDGRAGKFIEGKPWTAAKQLLESAKRDGLQVPIMFAGAEQIQELLYHGILTKVEIKKAADGKSKSVIRVVDLKPFRRPRPDKTDLIVESSGNSLSQNHIKTYVLCQTPEFVVGK